MIEIFITEEDELAIVTELAEMGDLQKYIDQNQLEKDEVIHLFY